MWNRTLLPNYLVFASTHYSNHMQEDPVAKMAARADRFKPLPTSAAAGIVKGSGVIETTDADFEAKKAVSIVSHGDVD
jgi:hypothetical protein